MEENFNKKHSICVYERKEIIIEGVKKLDSFDKNEFFWPQYAQKLQHTPDHTAG